MRALGPPARRGTLATRGASLDVSKFDGKVAQDGDISDQEARFRRFLRVEGVPRSLHCESQKARLSGRDDKKAKNQEKRMP